jgi:HNH endonuclease
MIQKTRLCCLSHGSIACFILLFLNIIVVPLNAQSDGLKVIVDNEREDGQVCVSSASETLPCKYRNNGGRKEFQFAPNAIPVGELFRVCLEDFCVTDRNSPKTEPQYVTIPISDGGTNQPPVEVQPSDTNQPPVEVQPSDTSQPSNQEDAGGWLGWLISILLIIIAAVIGIAIKKLTRKKERRGFPDIVKERVLKKQNHRCAYCKRLLNVVDWDHKNGKRNDNSESNCQALCPNCHAIKTRSNS